tara:strand:- start:173 stop:373 length:201 start_codon:yes stop_codon:yes gene_type:complete
MIVLNFALNKFMPFILISFLSFYKMGYQCIEPYAIFALAIFIARFNFKAGYSLAYCEKNNISLDVE